MAQRRVKYLNNRDLLKEIHKSKNTFCSYTAKEYHQYDLIISDLDKINIRTTAEAKRNQSVFRVMTFEHVPLAPGRKKTVKTVADAHEKVNFPPFQHWKFDDNDNLICVGKSHWKGDVHTGEFNKEHGKATDELAKMWMKLCERYATRGNVRGYTYNDEMRGQAILQLAQIGLQFDESKSDNPFAYYTAAVTNSFVRIINIEKRNQNIRDDILEMNGMNPSWTRQNEGRDNGLEHERGTIVDRDD